MYTNWNHKIVVVIAVLMLAASSVMAMAGQRSQDVVWDQMDKSLMQRSAADATGMPTAYEVFRLNKTALEALLAKAPEEFSGGMQVILSLPMPDGSYQRFAIEHSLVVERGLVKNFPELGATYRGYGIDDPTAFVRFDFLPSGFHSMILSTRGTVIVDPYETGNTDNYISYFKHDKPRVGGMECEVKGDDTFDPITTARGFDVKEVLPGFAPPPQTAPEVTSGTQLRTYRLALAGNNEYCVAVGGNTVAGCLAAAVLIMNRVNGVYEKDLAIRMVMVANNNLIMYAGDNLTCPVPGGTNPCTAANDPYGNDTSALSQNTPNLNTVIGSANYDIGHVFTTGSGGVAQLGVPCGGSKGAGTTGLPNPVGDPFAIDYVAHEMGHQWAANHTFNGTSGSCAGGNRSAGSAYEPGSGITIMAYAGICGAQDLAANSIDTFHVKSLEVIVAFSQTGGGNACAVTTASGNTPPAVTGPGNFNIPRLTPFALTATATDVNPGDSITYDWQEYDLGAAATTVPNSDTDGQARPIFRPFLPTASGTRTFPRLTHILNSANVPPNTTGGFMTGEILPSITRTMTFQVVARDNHAGTGGINSATSILSVDGNSGPFNVTAPNTAVSFPGNTFQDVTWNVANTAGAPVNAANVRISISTDGGNNFPTVLAASTANDGSESVLIPNTPSTTARIKVEAVGNIFFDISNTNFTITAGATGTPTPTATTTGSATPTNTATPTATATSTPCGAWVAGQAQPPGRYTLQAALGTDNKLYIAGGSSADATPVLSSQVSRFDHTTNTWSDVAPMPVAIGQGAMGSWNGKIYVAGGYLGGTAVTNALRIYDIATNTWSSGANIPTAGAGLEAAAGVVVNGKFYVIGGDDFNAALNTNFIYDIATNTWSTGATLPDLRTNVYGTTANGLIYVYGGLLGPGFTATDTLLRYDPVANSWTNLGTAGTVGLRGNYGGISPYGTGQLLITAGANTAYVASNTTRIFTIATGTFAAGPNMISARAGHAQGTLPDGRVLVALGLDTASSVTSGVELIGICPTGTPTNTPTATNTSTNTPTNTPTSGPTATSTSTPQCTPSGWQSGPAQPPARYALQGALGTDNKLYIAGGQSIDATPIVSNKFSRFNAATNAWEDLAPLPVALGQGTVGAAGGKVFVAGGFTGGTAVTNALRIYDIATNTWTSGANMPTAGVEAAAGAVISGKFYVMGGDDFNNLLNTNFIYDIATNTWSTGATLPDSRTNTYGTALNGLAYVYGGVNVLTPAFATTDTLLRYNPVTNSWTNLGSAGTAGLRGNYGGVSPLGSDQLLITDGANAAGASTTATHIFTISSGTFSAGPPMIEARAGHAQGTLPDGRVLVAAGFNATFATTTVELGSLACPSGTPTNTPTGSPTNTPTATATSTSTPAASPSASPSCSPSVLYDNGPIVTNPTGGAGGAPLSALQTALGLNILGFGATIVAPGNSLADDFVVPAGGFTINTVTLYGYQTGSPTAPSTFNTARVQIWNGVPGQAGSTVVFGDLTTNRFVSSAWSGAYRATDTAPTGATRPIMATIANVGTTLAAGTYWLEFQLGGTGASGPFVPPVSILGQVNKPGSNALQGSPAGTTFTAVVDTGTALAPQDIPFILNGAGACGTPTATATATATATNTPTNTPTSTATATPGGTPGTVFANSTAICTTLGAQGAPYPSNITVAGGPNQINGLSVTLFNIVHQLPDNMDFLLVGPNGAEFILMADAGGALPQSTPGVTLTFSDAAGAVLPDSAALSTGTFEPTSWEAGQTSFPAPAPPAPYNEPGSTVGGTGTQTLIGNFGGINSNGVWSLYMRDDAGLRIEAPTAITGCVNGGWQITFIPSTAAQASISGRVMTAGGIGIRNATVVLTGNSLVEPLVAQTGSFGYYTFEGLQTGETYVLTVNSRRFTFSAPSRVISLVDNVVDADFIADPQE